MDIQWTVPISGSTASNGVGKVMIDGESHTVRFHSAAGRWQMTVHDATGEMRWIWKGSNDYAWSVQDPEASDLCNALLEMSRSKWTSPDDYHFPIHVSTPLRIHAVHRESESRGPELTDGGPDWELRMSHRQLRLLAEALEFYERTVGLGQLEEFAWALTMRENSRYDPDKQRDVENLLVLLKKRVFDLDRNQSFGIYSAEVPEKFRVVYDMFKVARKRLAETEIARLRMNGDNKGAERVAMTVWNDEVYASSSEQPLITVKKADL